MPTAVPAVMPTHLGRRLLRTILDRRRRARIAQRHRVSALARRCQNQQRPDSSKSQNFRHIHICSPWVQDLTSAPNRLNPSAVSPRRRSLAEACDVNVSCPLRRETKCTRRDYVPAADGEMQKNSLDFRIEKNRDPLFRIVL